MGNKGFDAQEEALARAFLNGRRYIAFFDFGEFEVSTVIEEDGLTREQVHDRATQKLKDKLMLLNDGADDFTNIQCFVEVLE